MRAPPYNPAQSKCGSNENEDEMRCEETTSLDGDATNEMIGDVLEVNRVARSTKRQEGGLSHRPDLEIRQTSRKASKTERQCKE